MGDGTVRRRGRHSRPGVEGLEGRALMSTGAPGVTAAQVSAAQTSSTTSGSKSTSTTTSSSTSSTTSTGLKEFDYTTATGARVQIQLFGDGDLTGTYVDPDGALNLRFSGTNAQTGIIGHVFGGGGTAPLRSLIHLDLPSESLSGIGSSLLNVVRLKNFDLVAGGRINLTGGVHILELNSVGPNTQVSLRQTPPSLLPGASSTTAATTSASTTGSTTSGSTSGSVSAGGTSSSSSGSNSSTSNGVTLGFLATVAGAQTLTSVGGAFIPGFTTLPASSGTVNNAGLGAVGPPPAPAGVVISINHVDGPARSSSSLGNPQIFAYDATTNQLVRFDTTTGQGTAVVNDALPTGASTSAGVALSRVNGTYVVLVDNGQTVYAYNPETGAPVGSFSTAPLQAEGLPNPTRLATFDAFTAISDPTGGSTGLGEVVPIDVAASLASGQATVLTDPAAGAAVASFTSTRMFQLTGGFAGLPGSSTLFAVGAGHFDQYQPLQYQLGLSTLTPGVPSATSAGAGLTETNRAALTGHNTTAGTIVTNAQGVTAPGQGAALPAGNPNNAFGNIDLTLALDVGRVTNATTGQVVNAVNLYSPSTLAKIATISLNTPDVLTGLTRSYRPSLAGVALVDVQGNTQSFRAQDARGLVFNTEGYVYLMKVHNAVDTTAVGYPLLHAQMPQRTDVTLISSTRPVIGTRNGVSVVPAIRATGPLSLP